MSDNPYDVLAIKRDASAEEIQRAFRKLAKKHHPDLNPGDPRAAEAFKRISGAYDILGDPEKRARFDRGEIDASGTEKPPHRFYRDFADASDGHPYASAAGFEDMTGTDDLLSELLRRRTGTSFRMRGADRHLRLSIDFLEAVNGTNKHVVLPDGTALDFVVPAGVSDGQILGLAGKGEPGLGGAPPGDALVQLEVRPHRLFRREEDDIRLDLPISLTEAVLGGRVEVPTPTGRVTMSIPKGSNTGKVLRLRGKGVPRPQGGHGDMYVTLQVVLPENDPDLETFVTHWQRGLAHNPRRDLEREA
ncbi:DnaJ C-terminal domain-containing protein [Methylorubrum extorquens]